MPGHEGTRPISEQLDDALAACGVSQKELARRLADADGTKPESKRRWIQKLLRDEVDRPDISEIATALNLPSDYFVVPTPAQTRQRRARLEEVAAEVAALRSEFDSFVEAATARLAVLEVGQEQTKQQ